MGQLLQKQGKETHAAETEAAAVLVQVREHVQKQHGNFRSTMQRDLFDMLASFEDAKQGFLKPQLSAAFLGEETNSEFRSTTLLPWEDSEEQIGMEAKPNDLEGYAAGAKSYNAR